MAGGSKANVLSAAVRRAASRRKSAPVLATAHRPKKGDRQRDRETQRERERERDRGRTRLGEGVCG